MLNKKLLFISLLCFVLVIFVGFVVYGFPDSPSSWFDEGINLGIARTAVEDGVYSLKIAPGQFVEQRPLLITTNYPLLGFIILSFKLFGVGLAQAKVVMIIFLSLFLFVAYILTKRFFNNQLLAIIGLALVVTFLPFYGNGLSGGIGEVVGLFYFLVGLILIESERPLQVFLAGLFFGLCAATKTIYLSVIFAVGVGEIFQAFRNRGFPWLRWLLLGVGIFVPILVLFWTLIPGSGHTYDLHKLLTFYQNPYHTSRAIIFINFKKFFTEQTPIHFSILFVIFLVNTFLSRKNYKQISMRLILLVFMTVNLAWFLETPGWYRYFFPAHLLAILFFSGEIFQLCERTTISFIRKYGAAIVLLPLLIFQTTHLIKERSSTLYYNPEPRILATSLKLQFKLTDRVLIIDHPELTFLLDLPNVYQWIHLNPYITIGRNLLAESILPEYIVSNDPAVVTYLNPFKPLLEKNYSLMQRDGPYFIYKKKQ